MPDLRIGQVVTSRAGRDAGKAFLVIGLEGDRVAIADGDLRKVESAKKKNVKHVVGHDWVEPELAARISRGDMVTNSEIRGVVEAWHRKTPGEVGEHGQRGRNRG